MTDYADAEAEAYGRDIADLVDDGPAAMLGGALLLAAFVVGGLLGAVVTAWLR